MNFENVDTIIECLQQGAIYHNSDGNISAIWGILKSRVAKERKAAEHRVQLTAFGVGMLAFLAGFGVCWLVFVR